jgi:hypothetical protein
MTLHDVLQFAAFVGVTVGLMWFLAVVFLKREKF